MENKINDLEFVFGYNRDIHQYQVLHCKDCPYFSGIECHGHGEYYGSCGLMTTAIKYLSRLFDCSDKHLYITKRNCFYLLEDSVCPFFHFVSFVHTPFSTDYKVKLAESVEERKCRIYSDIFDRFFCINRFIGCKPISMKELVDKSNNGLREVDE